MADRDGFLIKNVGDVGSSLPVAEADKGDFLILGNARGGVLNGMKCTLAGYDVSVALGQVVVEGVLYTVGADSISGISRPATGARFDLIVYDSSAGVMLVSGVEASTGHPVFPDITDTMVVLASYYFAAGSGDPVLTDKRYLLAQSLYGVHNNALVTATDVNGTVVFSLEGEAQDAGWMVWSDGTQIQHTGLKEITIIDDLRLKNLYATENVYINDVRVTTVNDLDTAIADLTTPVGTIIMRSSSADIPGYLLLNGAAVASTVAPDLAALMPSWVSGGSITLPDMTGQLPLKPTINGGDLDPSLDLTPPSIPIYYFIKV